MIHDIVDQAMHKDTTFSNDYQIHMNIIDKSSEEFEKKQGSDAEKRQNDRLFDVFGEISDSDSSVSTEYSFSSHTILALNSNDDNGVDEKDIKDENTKKRKLSTICIYQREAISCKI